MRALATLCVLLASGCNLVLGLEDHEVAAPGGAGASGSGGATGGGGAAQGTGGGTLRTLNLTVTDDADDCVWAIDKTGTGLPHELLVYDTTNWRIFVSTDADAQRIGLRFPLGELVGAKVLSARLVLTYEQGNNDGRHQVAIRVWDAVDVDPFVERHQHGPEGHDPAGFWSKEVLWTPPHSPQADTSPDLSSLVQHIVDRSDFGAAADPHATFVIFPVPDSQQWYVGYQDSSAPGSDAPRLELEYLSPD